MSEDLVRATVKFKNGTQMDVPITPSLLKLGIHIVLDAMFQGNNLLLDFYLKPNILYLLIDFVFDFSDMTFIQNSKLLRP